MGIDRNDPLLDKILFPSIKTNVDEITNCEAFSAIIEDNDGNILIAKQAQLELWSIPAEKVDAGKAIEVALKYTLQRDFNIIAKEFIKINTFSHNYFIENKVVNMVQHQFLILNYQGNVKTQKKYKYERFKWISIEDLRLFRDITYVTREYLRYLYEK